MSLKAEFRKSQAMADAGKYPQAFGSIERAVAAELGPECLCPDCGGPNREDGKRCPMCEKATTSRTPHH